MPAVTLRLALAASGLAACAASAAPTAATRDPSDDAERAALRVGSPQAALLLEKGEALATSGGRAEIEEANALFRQGHALYPDGSLLWRRDCETRTVLGPRRDAVIACAAARERAHSDATVRALVSALVDGPSAPSPTDLVEALMVTAKERENPLGQVTAAAAACDIAERIGDGPMLQRCAGELTRLAPRDRAALGARAALDRSCPPARFWGGWLAIAGAALLTLGDALRRAPRRRTRGSLAAAATVLAWASLAAIPHSASAQTPQPARPTLSRWPVDPDHPELAIPSAKERDAEPLEFGYWLQDVALRGERASDAGEHAAAARYYAALAKAVPDRAVGFAKACQEYEAAGDLAQAASACGDALLRDGTTVADYTRFVRVILARPGPLGAKESAALGQVLAHMRKDPAGAEVVDELECQVGVRTSNVAQLEECTTGLTARAPGNPKSITYRWALALERGNLEEARKCGEKARAAGVAPESLEAMENATRGRELAQRRRAGLVAATIALVLAALALVGGALVRRRAVSPPAGGDGAKPATP